MSQDTKSIHIEEAHFLKKISHDEFKAFAKEQMAREGFYKRTYIIFLTLSGLSFFAAAGYGGSLFVLKEQVSYPLQLVAGLATCFTLLIVLHEILHGIAYKLVGAKKVYFGAIISKFVFYAGSDQEEFDGKQFRFIALFPFLCILLVCLVGLLLYPEYFLFTLTILFLHTLFCGGDFAILNFMQQYNLSAIYTCDSRKERETYFYRK